MLEKIPRNQHINKLQIVVIVEGDMIRVMKVIWNRRLVPRAETCSKLHPVQFGNRKGKTFLNTLLLKVITMDTVRIFRLNGTLLNNDAVACYDCMIPELTSVHLQSLGLPAPAAKYSIK